MRRVVNSSVAVVVTLLLLSISGCAHFRPIDLSHFPESRRTIFVHNTTNETFEPIVHQELNQALRTETIRRRNFHHRADRADAALWLYSELTVWRREGRMYDNFRNPTRYELIAATRIRLRENPLFSNMERGDLVNVEVSARIEYSPREGFPESEQQARQRLMQLLAARVHNILERGYVSQLSE